MPKYLSALEQDLLTLLVNESTYGLELLSHLNHVRLKHGISKLGIGSLYPTLQRMEKYGLVTSEQIKLEDSSLRRYYKITTNGKKAVERMSAYRNELMSPSGALPATEAKTVIIM